MNLGAYMKGARGEMFPIWILKTQLRQYSILIIKAVVYWLKLKKCVCLPPENRFMGPHDDMDNPEKQVIKINFKQIQ